MYILIIEDDKLQFDYLKEGLSNSKHFFDLEINHIVTESEFQTKFEEISSNKPYAIIMDVMIRWADASLNMPIPSQEIIEEGLYRAGFRCEKMLANDPRTSDIPIIFYTVLEYNDIIDDVLARPQVSFLLKDFSIDKIEEKLLQLIPNEQI